MIINNLRKKGFLFSLQLSGHTPSPREVKTGTQGRNLEAGSDAESMEECCPLDCSPWLTQPASYTIQDHLSKGGTTHNMLGPPTVLLILKMPYRLAYKPTPWKHFLYQDSFLPDDPNLCQVDIKTSTTCLLDKLIAATTWNIWHTSIEMSIVVADILQWFGPFYFEQNVQRVIMFILLLSIGTASKTICITQQAE